MYPNATIRNTGGGANNDWQNGLSAKLKSQIPEGADGYRMQDDGVIVFTKGGQDMANGKFNADGSQYDPTKSQNANKEVAKPSNNSAVGNGNGNGNGNSAGKTGNGSSSSMFGYGFNNGASGDLSANFVNGNYDIDPNKFMGAAMGFNAMSSIANMMPFGLGSLFAQNTLGTMLGGFMKAVSFNFDFSGFKVSSNQDGNGNSVDDTNDDGTPSSTPTAEDTPKAEATPKAEETPKAEATPKAEETPKAEATPKAEETPKATTTPQNNEYKVSRHTSNVFYKSINGSTHYYIEKNGEKVEVGNYNGKTYTLNGKTYNAKTGEEVTAQQTQQTKQKQQTKQTKNKGANKEYWESKGYTYHGGAGGIYWKKDNAYWAYDAKANVMRKCNAFYPDGSYRSGNKTYGTDGTVLGTFTKGANAGSYSTNNSSQSTPGHNYGNGNKISKEATTRVGTDSDAQFKIANGTYNMKRDSGSMIDTTLDYYDITGQRTTGQHSGFKFVNSDGSFNANANMFNDGSKVYLSGQGEFDGCEVKAVRDMEGVNRVCIKSGNVYYDFETMMRTGKKVQIRPGTFLSQG